MPLDLIYRAFHRKNHANSPKNRLPDTKKVETLEDFARGIERALMASGVSMEALACRLLAGRLEYRKAQCNERSRKIH